MGLPQNNRKRPLSNIDQIVYESSSSNSSDDIYNFSDGDTQFKVRPSRLKIVMKSDKVKKKEKSTLELCLNSFRKIDFIRKSNLFE
jgi:hypothetical protein